MSRPPPPSALSVELYGFGRVGRALLPLLGRHGIEVAEVRDSSGVRRTGAGSGRRVFVDATSPQYHGAPAHEWVRRLETVLGQGTPVVTCNKAPLALEWARLSAAARRGRTTLSCSATVGGGTPILHSLQRLHLARGIVRIDATLTATLGVVCDRVTNGFSIEAAVSEAQRSGIAEPDPTLDLDGTDSYAKSVIVHNLLFTDHRPLVLRSDRRRLRLEEREIRDLARDRATPRVISCVTATGVDVRLAPFGPFAGAPTEPALASVRATVQDGSETVISGPGAGPEATAGAMLADLLHLTEPYGPPAGGICP